MNLVYYSFINDLDLPISCIKDKARNDYINSISNKKRRFQSYAVWKLLECAIDANFNCDYEFFLYGNKWREKNNKFYFSLSHSKNAVAVAISSDEEIGVDVEYVSEKILRAENLLLKDKNFCTMQDKVLYLTKQWVKYESKFKSNYNGKSYLKKICNNKDVFYISCNSKNKVKFIKVNNKNFLY